MLYIPSIIQKPNHCGPATLAMLGRFYGLECNPDQIAEWAGTTDNGTSLSGMLAGTRKLGLYTYYQDNASFEDLKRAVYRGVPPIVDWFVEVTGHYSLVADINDTEIALRDPLLEELRIMDLRDFEDVWFDFEGPRPEKNSFFVRRMIVAQPIRACSKPNQ